MIHLISEVVSTCLLIGFGSCFFRGDGFGLDDWWEKPLFLLLTAFTLWVNYGNSWFILSGTLGMLLGMVWGWGAYIQAIQGQGAGNRAQIKIIDWIINPLLSNPVLWGVTGLSLRGLIWTSSLGASLFNWRIVPLGLLMGPVYWLATKIKTTFIDPWKLGEIFFGILLGLGIVLGKRKKDDPEINGN